MNFLCILGLSKPAERLSPAEACEIARRYYVTGRRKIPNKNRFWPPDREVLLQFLNQRNEFVNYWIGWSEDKRWSPAWFFRKVDGGFEVGLVDSSEGIKKTVFYVSAEEACADYILKELSGEMG